MSHYTAPVEDMGFVLKEVVGLEKVCEEAGLDTSTVDIIETVLDAAGKLAKEESLIQHMVVKVCHLLLQQAFKKCGTLPICLGGFVHC